MSLRFVAVAAALAVAITLAAGYLATHQKPPTSYTPADKNVQAYQALMRADDNALAASLSNHCGSVSDTGCIAALARIAPPAQKWVADLQAFKTPEQFVVIDGQVRQHAAALLTDLNIATAAVRAQNNPGLVNAINAGGSQASWLSRTASSISEWQQVKASDYVALVKTDGQSLSICAGCQAMSAADFPSCAGSQLDACISNIIPADDLIGQVQTDVISSAAPAAFAGKDQRLQVDLAAADTALITMLNALLAQDASAVNASVTAYRSALAAVSADIAAITG